MEDDEKNFKTLLIPTVTYNNSFGGVFGFMASGFYKINLSDTISSQSKSLLIGTYSTNNTWFLIQPNKFYFLENKYRGSLVLGSGQVNF